MASHVPHSSYHTSSNQHHHTIYKHNSTTPSPNSIHNNWFISQHISREKTCNKNIKDCILYGSSCNMLHNQNGFSLINVCCHFDGGNKGLHRRVWHSICPTRGLQQSVWFTRLPCILIVRVWLDQRSITLYYHRGVANKMKNQLIGQDFKATLSCGKLDEVERCDDLELRVRRRQFDVRQRSHQVLRIKAVCLLVKDR